MSSESFIVKIEKMSLGGSGIARLQDGPVVFVPFSAPGDELAIKILEKKKNYWLGEIIKILVPSPHRIPAPCPLFQSCGGCQWQHISYTQQLQQKTQIVEEELSKALRKKVEVDRTHPSPKEYHYRNRIQLHVQGEKFGFFSKGTHSLINIDRCLIAEEPINEALKGLKTNKSGRLEIALDTNEKIQIRKLEDSEIEAFSQVNRFQNEVLQKQVINWVRESNCQKIYEFYAGSGNFTFPLLSALPKIEIEAVELSPFSVGLAQEKIRNLHSSPQKISFYQGDVEAFLKRRVLSEGSTVLLDPPRTGCSEQFIHLLLSNPITKIIYLSCHPATLARDLSRIVSNTDKKWRIKRVEVFDMFPQTYHIETLVELEH